MTFPVEILGLHPHRVFDILAFFVGGQLFWWHLRQEPDGGYTREERWFLTAGCVLGAAIGAKLIVLLEAPAVTVANLNNPLFWLSGKSIVGALLGGLAGVEIAKKEAGIVESTGDHFAVPVAVGLGVGRIGCFLTGLADDTYGTPTALPWGVDFGDGIGRHPTQLYEMVFAFALAGFLWHMRDRTTERGDRFRFFMVAYFAFRLVEEFIRVSPTPYLGLSVYQVGCLVGLAYYLRDAGVRRRLVLMSRVASRRRDGPARARPPTLGGP